VVVEVVLSLVFFVVVTTFAALNLNAPPYPSSLLFKKYNFKIGHFYHLRKRKQVGLLFFSSQHPFPILSNLPIRPNIPINRRPGDPQLLAQIPDHGLLLPHRNLGQANLSLGEGKPPASLAAACARRGKTGHGSLADQLPFELGQGRENPENKFPACGRRVDFRPLACKDLEPDAFKAKNIRNTDCKKGPEEPLHVALTTKPGKDGH
jgi:hypothetical protein